MSIGGNIKKRRNKLGMTLEDVAKVIGVSRQTLSRYETGVIGNIPSDKIEALASVLRTTPAYLMGWEDTKNSIPADTDINVETTDDVVTFHPVGTVAAGYNEFAYQEIAEDSIDIPTSYLKGRTKSDYFLLKVTGDSMYPLYHNGDHVLVLKQETLNRSGEIGVVLYGGDKATLKKVEYVEGENWMRLVPINPTYKELLVKDADLEQCRILGIPRVLIRDL